MGSLNVGVDNGGVETPARDTSVAAAFRTTLDLFATGIELMRQNLRRSHPKAGEADITRLLHEWLVERPGAESGDSPGRVVDVNSRLA